MLFSPKKSNELCIYFLLSLYICHTDTAHIKHNKIVFVFTFMCQTRRRCFVDKLSRRFFVFVVVVVVATSIQSPWEMKTNSPTGNWQTLYYCQPTWRPTPAGSHENIHWQSLSPSVNEWKYGDIVITGQGKCGLSRRYDCKRQPAMTQIVTRTAAVI